MTDAIERQGYTAGTMILKTSFGEAGDDERKSLALNPGEGVLMVERIRTADGEPVVYCIDRIPARLVPEGYTAGGESILNGWRALQGCEFRMQWLHLNPWATMKRFPICCIATNLHHCSCSSKFITTKVKSLSYTPITTSELTKFTFMSCGDGCNRGGNLTQQFSSTKNRG